MARAEVVHIIESAFHGSGRNETVGRMQAARWIGLEENDPYLVSLEWFLGWISMQFVKFVFCFLNSKACIFGYRWWWENRCDKSPTFAKKSFLTIL